MACEPAGTVFFTGTSPLTAIQLLWLNLITDGAPALALGTEKGDPDIMRHPPRPPSEPIINKFMQVGIAIQTIAKTVTVYCDNEPALKLYRRFGFEIEGIHRAYSLRDGQYTDTYAMARLHPRPPQLPRAAT